MQSVDWMVMPSIWWENSPIVIQEAFFHGRPLICSNIGGMAEKITDGVNGLHFRVGSPEDLADRMTQAMSTPELWDRLRDGRPDLLDADGCAAAHSNSTTGSSQARAAPAARGREIRTASGKGRTYTMARILVITRPAKSTITKCPVVQCQPMSSAHRPLPQHRRRLRLRFLAQAPQLRASSTLVEIVDPKFATSTAFNAEYDYVFLRGSNYIHARDELAAHAEVLRRLKIPVIAFGIGAQAPVKGKLELSDETKPSCA